MKPPRYVLQSDRYSCGPIAILNALKWAGQKINKFELLPFLQFACRTIDLEYPEDFDLNGTHDSDFERVLRYTGKGMFFIKRPKILTVKQLKLHLKRGGALAFSYYWKDGADGGEHWAFMPEYKNSSFMIVNDHTGEVVKARSEKTIRQWFRKKYSSPTFYLLTLKK